MNLKKISALFLAMIMCLGGISVSAAETTPFKNHKIPGTIKVSDFDNGGPGVAFGEVANPAGNYEYRSDANGKINFYADDDGGAYLGFINGGWLIFTVNVEETGTYEVYSEYATTVDSAVTLAADGAEILSAKCNIGTGWLPMEEQYLGDVKLTKGKHTLKFSIVNGGINVRNIIFRGQGGGSDKSGPYKNHFAPCVIQAEDFDNGAAACVSLDGKNNGKAYRTNALLDIGQVGKTDQYYLELNETESATYTFNVETSNAYALYAAAKSMCNLEFSFDGRSNAAVKKLESAADYTETEIVNVWLDKGVHTLKVTAASGKANIDYFRIGNATGDYFTVDNVGALDKKDENNGSGNKSAVSDYTLESNGIYKNLYISADGNDEADGSENAPFKTIARAKEEVRKLRENMTGDIVVNIYPGTYTLKEKEVFNEEDGGKDGYNIIYQGIGNEKTVISGGTPVTGWQKRDDGIWVADCEDIEDTRALYVDGFPAVRARSKYTYRAGEYVGDKDGFVLTANEPCYPEIRHNVEDVELVWEILWCLQYTPVKNIYQQENGLWVYMMDQPWFSYYRTAPGGMEHTATKTGGTFYISNALELLDEPGEFYFDKKEKKMYYYPYKAQNMETAEIVAGTCEKMISVAGSSKESKVKGIAFRNLDFKYGAWNEASEKGFAGIQAGMWVYEENQSVLTGGEIMPSQLTFEYAENVEISDCRFSNLGSCAIGMNNSVSRAEIKGNVFTDISADAVSVGHWDHKNTMPEGWEMVCDVTVENNVMRRTGNEFGGSAAVSVYYTNNVNVVHNDIADVPYTGVTLGWGWGVEDILAVGNNKIMYNNIYDVCKCVVDGANIYTLGKQRNGIIAGNHLVKSGDFRGGIYHDQGSSYFTDYENVVELEHIGALKNNWYFAPNESMIDNKAYDNFANIPNIDINASCKDQVSVTNTTVVTDGNWPEKALEIMENAGVEEKYRKNLEGVERREFEIVRDGEVPNKLFERIDPNDILVEAEDYKEGGEGVGYHKNEQANHNAYRNDGVWTANLLSDGYVIGNTCAGEWLEYDIYVKKSDVYDIVCNFSNQRDGVTDDGNPLINLYLDGILIADRVESQNTGSWDIYIDQIFATTEIEAGEHTFRLEFYNNGFSFDKFMLHSINSESQTVYDEGIMADETVMRGFTDIKGHWAESIIKDLSERDIIHGKSVSEFAPEDSVSLYESILLAMRTMGINYDEENWKETAAEMKLYNGETDYAVSREKFIEIVMNAYEAKYKTYSVNVNAEYGTDWADADEKYYQHIRGAYKLGLVNGDEDGKLRPKDTLTRAEAAAVLSRI